MSEDYLPQMPPECLWVFNEISKIGASQGYKPDSWTFEHPMSHAMKAVGHVMDFLLGRKKEPHLYHAMWRICAATAMLIRMRKMGVVQTGAPLADIEHYTTPGA